MVDTIGVDVIRRLRLEKDFAGQLSVTEKAHHRTLRNHYPHRLRDGCRVPAAHLLARLAASR